MTIGISCAERQQKEEAVSKEHLSKQYVMLNSFQHLFRQFLDPETLAGLWREFRMTNSFF
jgi:hypothetical protein